MMQHDKSRLGSERMCRNSGTPSWQRDLIHPYLAGMNNQGVGSRNQRDCLPQDAYIFQRMRLVVVCVCPARFISSFAAEQRHLHPPISSRTNTMTFQSGRATELDEQSLTQTSVVNVIVSNFFVSQRLIGFDQVNLVDQVEVIFNREG